MFSRQAISAFTVWRAAYVFATGNGRIDLQCPRPVKWPLSYEDWDTLANVAHEKSGVADGQTFLVVAITPLSERGVADAIA